MNEKSDRPITTVTISLSTNDLTMLYFALGYAGGSARTKEDHEIADSFVNLAMTLHSSSIIE